MENQCALQYLVTFVELDIHVALVLKRVHHLAASLWSLRCLLQAAYDGNGIRRALERGGSNCVTFHCEKFKPLGPPSGGNGGRSSDVYILPTPALITLLYLDAPMGCQEAHDMVLAAWKSVEPRLCALAGKSSQKRTLSGVASPRV